jgi:hypothetical protein
MRVIYVPVGKEDISIGVGDSIGAGTDIIDCPSTVKYSIRRISDSSELIVIVPDAGLGYIITALFS